MTEHVEKYTNKAIEIIADYIQRTNKKNEQLQEAKVRIRRQLPRPHRDNYSGLFVI